MIGTKRRTRSCILGIIDRKPARGVLKNMILQPVAPDRLKGSAASTSVQIVLLREVGVHTPQITVFFFGNDNHLPCIRPITRPVRRSCALDGMAHKRWGQPSSMKPANLYKCNSLQPIYLIYPSVFNILHLSKDMGGMTWGRVVPPRRHHTISPSFTMKME